MARFPSIIKVGWFGKSPAVLIVSSLSFWFWLSMLLLQQTHFSLALSACGSMMQHTACGEQSVLFLQKKVTDIKGPLTRITEA